VARRHRHHETGAILPRRSPRTRRPRYELRLFVGATGCLPRVWGGRTEGRRAGGSERSENLSELPHSGTDLQGCRRFTTPQSAARSLAEHPRAVTYTRTHASARARATIRVKCTRVSVALARTLINTSFCRSFLAATPLFGTLQCRCWALLMDSNESRVSESAENSRASRALSFFLLFVGGRRAHPTCRARLIEITDRCHTVERAFELFIATVLLRADLLQTVIYISRG